MVQWLLIFIFKAGYNNSSKYGSLTQRESASLTRKKSLVQIQYDPPYKQSNTGVFRPRFFICYLFSDSCIRRIGVYVIKPFTDWILKPKEDSRGLMNNQFISRSEFILPWLTLFFMKRVEIKLGAIFAKQ